MVLSIYTDGSCKPNPGGAMRIGVVVMRGEQVVHSFARNMGMGTNNQAELLAVREAAERRCSAHCSVTFSRREAT